MSGRFRPEAVIRNEHKLTYKPRYEVPGFYVHADRCEPRPIRKAQRSVNNYLWRAVRLEVLAFPCATCVSLITIAHNTRTIDRKIYATRLLVGLPSVDLAAICLTRRCRGICRITDDVYGCMRRCCVDRRLVHRCGTHTVALVCIDHISIWHLERAVGRPPLDDQIVYVLAPPRMEKLLKSTLSCACSKY